MIKLNMKKLLYPITIFSIHGEEIATEAVELPTLNISSSGQTVTINDIKLIVYFILAFIFGPYIAFHFSFIGDFYSLSKTYVYITKKLFLLYF